MGDPEVVSSSLTARKSLSVTMAAFFFLVVVSFVAAGFLM
jgi:hypothetical protein